MKFRLKRELGLYEPELRWYMMPAYENMETRCIVCYPIGIHFAVKLARRLWLRMSYWRPSKWEQYLLDAWNQGYQLGKRHSDEQYIVRLKDRIDEVNRRSEEKFLKAARSILLKDY